MAQATVRLVTEASRRQAAQWVWGAEVGTLVTFANPHKRTLAQNAHMWAALTDIAAAMPWHGQWLPADDWKLLFLADMGRGIRMVPALDGRGFVNLNVSSSALTSREFAVLLDGIHKFAEDHGIQLGAGLP
jgi:hypothetical protein